MTLIELVQMFRLGFSFDHFVEVQSLDPDAEVIEIFAQTPVSLESTLGFFEIEKTEGQVLFFNDSKEYRSLFDFFYFEEAIKESINENNGKFTDSDIAKKLLHYALNDA